MLTLFEKSTWNNVEVLRDNTDTVPGTERKMSKLESNILCFNDMKILGKTELKNQSLKQRKSVVKIEDTVYADKINAISDKAYSDYIAKCNDVIIKLGLNTNDYSDGHKIDLMIRCEANDPKCFNSKLANDIFCSFGRNFFIMSKSGDEMKQHQESQESKIVAECLDVLCSIFNFER